MSPVAALIAGLPSRRTDLPSLLLAALSWLIFALTLAPLAWGAPVVEGPRSEVATVTCSIAEDGATTCAVSRGSASVCALRKGQDIDRSYRAYDYLNEPPGCTLGIEYWRTHAGGASFDEIWDGIGSEGAATAFFGSSLSFLDMLAPAAEEEDAYRALARVYVATELNRLNGADLPEPVRVAQDEASVMLLGSPSGTFDAATAQRSRELAAVLEEFLAGRSGPGFCAAMTEPLGPEDIGKTLVGVESEDTGTILRLTENREKPGEGVVTIGPLTAEDQFILADEGFAVEDIRKGRFTQEVNDCAIVDTGEETTVAVGGLPSDPTAISAFMQQLARNLQIMIALNTESEAPAPAAGPAGPPGGEAPPDGGAPTGPGGLGGFPSGVLPPVAGSGGSDLIPVPNLIGLTEAQARSKITSVGLTVGDVTVVSSLSPPAHGLVSSAYAQAPPGDEPLVIGQFPLPGFLCPPGCPVDVQLSAGAPPLPEPSSLPMIVVALAVLGFLLWRGRRGSTSGAALFLLVVGMSACENRAAEERIGFAKQYLEAGRPNGAVIELKKAIQQEPDNVEARRLLGYAYLGLGRLSDAEKELGRALSLQPGDADTTLALGRVWLRQGSAKRVLAEISPEPAWTPADRALGWILRGEAELAAGLPEEAKRSFGTATALDPTRIEALIGLARIAFQAEDDEAAGEVLDRALALAPQDPILLGLSGRRAFRAGDYAMAEDAFRRQAALTPEGLTARLDLAQALLAQNRDPEAAAEINQVLASAPEHPDARYLAALISLRTADFAIAGEHAKAALRARPQHQPTRAIAAVAAAELGRWMEARTQLDALKATDPDHPLPAELGTRVDQALAAADAVAESADEPRPLSRDLALFRLDAAGIAGLEEALTALERDESDSQIAFEQFLAGASASLAARARAIAVYRAGRTLAARLALQAWLEKNSADTDTRAVLVDLLLLEGDSEGALPYLRQLAAQRPRDAGILNNLAWTLMQRGELQEAGLLSERALALAPNDPRIMDTRGVVLLQAGDAAGAVAFLSRAVGSDAAPPETRVHLAQALIRQGDTAAARLVLTDTLATPEAAAQHRAAAILLQKLEP